MRTLALIAAGIGYVALVLFDGVQFPLFSLVFIVLAVHELRRLHRGWRRHS
jgi:hypothetical protein